MKKTTIPFICVFALSAMLSGCASTLENTLKAEVGDLVKNIQAGKISEAQNAVSRFVFDNAARFFTGVFGDAYGIPLGAEYEIERSALKERVINLIKEAVNLGRTSVRVRMVSADSKDAFAEEAAVLKKMNKVIPLYSVYLEKPGGGKVTGIWYFVLDGGVFKIAGKMNPPR